MTWTKLSDDFGDQCLTLSDAAFRTHVEGLIWASRREQDGRLSIRDVKRFAESENYSEAIEELLAVGYWTRQPDGYQIRHHLEHQLESDVIQARREKDAKRQRRHRRKLAGLPPGEDLSRCDETRDPGRVGTGRGGAGEAIKATPVHSDSDERFWKTSVEMEGDLVDD